MTPEDKQLLFKDICARLPYEVKIHIDFEEIGHIVGDATLDSIKTVTGQFDFVGFEQDFKNGDCLPISGLCGNKLLCIDEFKPYLRPMSSMTEEEKRQYTKTQDKIPIQWDDYGESTVYTYANTIKTYDWLNKNHFDYRGLIQKGLALVAPEDMYKTE